MSKISQGLISGGVTNFLIAHVTLLTMPGLLYVVLEVEGDEDVVELDEDCVVLDNDVEPSSRASSTCLTFLSLFQQLLAKWPTFPHTKHSLLSLAPLLFPSPFACTFPLCWSPFPEDHELFDFAFPLPFFPPLPSFPLPFDLPPLPYLPFPPFSSLSTSMGSSFPAPV